MKVLDRLETCTNHMPSSRVRVNDNHDYDDEDKHGVIVNEDDERHDGKRDHEDVNVHREASRGGGWCLEWLHPPPKGVQR